jgi:hypothetical protein
MPMIQGLLQCYLEYQIGKVKNMSKNNDLKPDPFPKLDWDNASTKDNLQKVFDYIDKVGGKAIGWYHKNKKPKKRWGRALRVLAIFLTAFAGLIPLLHKIDYLEKSTISVMSMDPTTQINSIVIDPAWSAVLIALAALAIGLDKFLGFTNSWVRFMTTASSLECKQQDFRITWEIAQVKLGKSPTPSQIEGILTIAHKYLNEVCNDINKETQKWVNDFQAALLNFEKATKEVQAEIKEKTSDRQYGALKLKVQNGLECEEPWEVKLDGNVLKTVEGGSCAITKIYRGIHELEVTGKINGKSAKHTDAVIIKGGEVETKEFSLAYKT